MIEKKIGFPFVVEPFQEDSTGHLSWSNFGNHVLRVSSLHAESHGFGYTYMQKHQRGWVLARLILEVDELPRTNEPYTLSTWVSKIFNQFTERLYTLTSPDGKLIGRGTSTWALIDYASRQPVNLQDLPDGGFSHALLEESVNIAKPSKCRVNNEVPISQHTAVFSDLDINGHVNSIRYIDLMLDTFSKEWYDQHRVSRIEMSYGLEGYFGDLFQIYRQPINDTTFALQIVRPPRDANEKPDIIVRGVVYFSPR